MTSAVSKSATNRNANAACTSVRSDIIAPHVLSFDSEEGGFVSFEKVDDKLIVRIGLRSGFMDTATIPAEAVEHLACLSPEGAA